MRIRMLSLAAGPNGTYLPGWVYSTPHDVSEEQARAFVKGGYAEELIPQAVHPEKQIETADAPAEAVETAVPAAPRKRPRRKEEE